MKPTFLVITSGYWGRSTESISKAAEQCERAGAMRGAKCVAYVVIGDDIPIPDGTGIYHAPGSTLVNLGTFGLGTLIRFWNGEPNDHKRC